MKRSISPGVAIVNARIATATWLRSARELGGRFSAAAEHGQKWPNPLILCRRSPLKGCDFEVDASEPLGVKLRRLRKERGLSLTDFADKVGVSRPTVWSWETGKTKPRRQKLDAVAATLNLMDDELILDIAEVEERTKARSLEREISAAKARIAKIAGTLPEAVDITIRW